MNKPTAFPKPNIAAANSRIVSSSAVLLAMLACVAFQESSAQSMPQIEDAGDFILEPVPEYLIDSEAKVAQYLDRKLLAQIVDRINDKISLAANVRITFGPWAGIQSLYSDEEFWQQLGESAETVGTDANAFFDPRHDVIYIGYEKITDIADVFYRNGDSEELSWSVFINLVKSLLHEMGHAVNHVNEIGIPELGSHLVADQFAFYMITHLSDSDDLLRVSTYYRYRNNELQSTANSNHPQDLQRARNFLCWIFGRDESSGMARQEGELWQDCQSKYERLMSNWKTRLAPFWKGQ